MRTIYAITFALAIYMPAIASTAVARPSSSDSMKEMMKECDMVSGEDSINACQELIRLRRFKGHTLSMIYNNLGVAHSRVSEYEQAVEALSNALRVDPRYILPRINRARNLAAIARFSDAIADMDAAIKLAPTAESYSFRADLRERNNDLDGAKSDYSEAIKKQPTVAVYYSSRGNIFGKLSQHAEAIEDYSRAIQLNPRDSGLYYSRGIAWMNAGKCDQAIPDYTKTIELSPRHSNAYLNRGYCLGRAGKRDEAMVDFESALKWEPGNEKARKNLEIAKNSSVSRPAPLVIEVPKFEVPPVRELLEVPEYSVIEVAPIELKKE